MAKSLGSRIIDGDGHIFEDDDGIIAHLDPAYRDVMLRLGGGSILPPLDHLHAGRAVETPPKRDGRPIIGPKGWIDFLDEVGIETGELTMPFAISQVGNKPFFYSSDFPHEVTVASCMHDIGELLESNEINDDDKAAILWRNAERFYQPHQ